MNYDIIINFIDTIKPRTLIINGERYVVEEKDRMLRFKHKNSYLDLSDIDMIEYHGKEVFNRLLYDEFC